MKTPLVRVVIPVVPRIGDGDARLREYRFRTDPDPAMRSTPILPFFSGDAVQQKVFSDLAANLRGLEADQAFGHSPGQFTSCVEVTVLGVTSTDGTSSMLGAACGFIAARAADPARLRTLTATGALALPTSSIGIKGRLGDCITVQPVAGMRRKLAAIICEPRPPEGLLIAVPAADHPDDAADIAAIASYIATLRERGDTVLRAERLSQVLAVWIAAPAWFTPQLAVAYAAAAMPRQTPHRPVRPRVVATALGGALMAAAGAYVYEKWPLFPPPIVTVEQVPTRPDEACGPGGPIAVGAGPMTISACKAFTACDAAAGSKLDPERRARGFGPGVGFVFLQQPDRAAAARSACEEAVRLAPTSAKARWHLSRVLEAQGETAAAALERELAAQAGEPMARLRQAQDLLHGGELGPAREQLRLLAQRTVPLPEATVDYATMLACGLGGARDAGAATLMVPRLREVAHDYEELLGRSTDLAKLLEVTADLPERPDGCSRFQP